MRKPILSILQNIQSDDLYYPSQNQHESDINAFVLDAPIISVKELELLFQEGLEYDFLIGKSPKELPDYWEEED